MKLNSSLSSSVCFISLSKNKRTHLFDLFSVRITNFGYVRRFAFVQDKPFFDLKFIEQYSCFYCVLLFLSRLPVNSVMQTHKVVYNVGKLFTLESRNLVRTSKINRMSTTFATQKIFRVFFSCLQILFEIVNNQHLFY